MKDIQAAYLQSPHFHDINQYLMSDKTLRAKRSRDKVLIDAQNYMILDTLLFKLVPEKITDGIKLLLCIPTSKIDMLLDHTSVSGCHTGITKCYLTISDRFYCLNLAHHIRAYITGCHVCQLLKAGCKFDCLFPKRINLNTPALTKVSMDIKDMPSMKADDIHNGNIYVGTNLQNIQLCCSIPAHNLYNNRSMQGDKTQFHHSLWTP